MTAAVSANNVANGRTTKIGCRLNGKGSVDWLFQIWFKDKLLVEQAFHTYREDKQERPVPEPH